MSFPDKRKVRKRRETIQAGVSSKAFGIAEIVDNRLENEVGKESKGYKRCEESTKHLGRLIELPSGLLYRLIVPLASPSEFLEQS